MVFSEFLYCGHWDICDLKSLTHWGRGTHTCFSNLTIIGSNYGLLPGQCQAIIWNSDGISLIQPLGINFSEILIKIYIFIQENALENVVWEMAAILSQPQRVDSLSTNTGVCDAYHSMGYAMRVCVLW